MDFFYTKLKQVTSRVQTHIPLARYTSFHIGGPARYIVAVKQLSEVQEVITLAQEEDIPIVVLGGGSNMLVSDEGFDGIVLKIEFDSFYVEGTTVVADAGARTVAVAHETIRKGLTGFEWGIGVPGTIGGAVRGNAGAMGREMKEVIRSVHVLRDGEHYELTASECDFRYRESIFKKIPGYILRVTMELTNGSSAIAGKQMQEFLQYRNSTQPKQYPSTGCIFKNYEIGTAPSFPDLKSKGIPTIFLEKKRIPAGWLIEHASMKGIQEGKAMVSDVHGNFIVNTDQATARDVRNLIEKIKKSVYTQFGVMLEEEIQYIGF